MQHFIKVFHGYLALQVTQVTWHQFQEDIRSSVKSIDDLYDSHDRFINKCLTRLDSSAVIVTTVHPVTIVHLLYIFVAASYLIKSIKSNRFSMAYSNPSISSMRCWVWVTGIPMMQVISSTLSMQPSTKCIHLSKSSHNFSTKVRDLSSPAHADDHDHDVIGCFNQRDWSS